MNKLREKSLEEAQSTNVIPSQVTSFSKLIPDGAEIDPVEWRHVESEGREKDVVGFMGVSVL